MTLTIKHNGKGAVLTQGKRKMQTREHLWRAKQTKTKFLADYENQEQITTKLKIKVKISRFLF